jgi:hypothetical protein
MNARMISREGERLYKHMIVKVFLPGNNRAVIWRMNAPNGKGFTVDAMEAELVRVAERVEQHFPAHEHRLVPVGPCRFNFVWEKEKSLT